jgi:predicted acyltransferase
LTPPRLVSLDVFRGLTMASMVIVNNPGDWGNVYAPLLHAPWHGLTPTDLIFPFFLFIVGVSITLAKRSSASAATILRRALLIFGLGMLLALYPRFDFSTVRIPGVLQRIAVCYLVVALFHRQVAPRVAQAFRPATARAIVIALAAAAALLLAYWALIFRDLTPEGNLGAAIDRAIFGPHLWRQSRTWDPEGLLSTLPAIGTTLTGLAAGYVITSDWATRDRLRALAIGSLTALAFGLAWSFAFPLNKSLWTSSYVLVTSGLAGLLLAALHWALDDDGWRRPSGLRLLAHPFVILGRNALLLFVVLGLLAKTLGLIRVDNGQGATMALGRWMYLSWFTPLADPKNASLLFAFANLAVLFLLLWFLHRRHWYFKV